MARSFKTSERIYFFVRRPPLLFTESTTRVLTVSLNSSLFKKLKVTSFLLFIPVLTSPFHNSVFKWGFQDKIAWRRAFFLILNLERGNFGLKEVISFCLVFTLELSRNSLKNSYKFMIDTSSSLHSFYLGLLGILPHLREILLKLKEVLVSRSKSRNPVWSSFRRGETL